MKIGKTMQSIIMASLMGYFSLVGGLYVAQRSLLYHPDQTIPLPSDYDVAQMDVVRIKGSDNVELHAWWSPPKKGQSSLVHFHGNAGHIGDRAHKIKDLISKGYGVLLMSYRYNANVAGAPTEAALIADGRHALKWLESQSILPPNITLYGESLGSGVAVALAAENDIKSLILEAPYSSVAEVAQSTYWFVPAYWLVKDKFNSVERIDDVRAPILIVHGAQDKTIPVKFGEKLFSAAHGGAKFIKVDDAGHANLYDYGMGDIVHDFLDTLN